MNFEVIVIICFGIFLFAIAMLIERNKKCKKCNARIKLESISDPLGKNISKKSVISFGGIPRKVTYTYKCIECGDVSEEKKWEK